MSDQPSCQLEDEAEGTNADYLSQLPRDCLISVFSLVNRYSLNELECVSKTFRAVVQNPSLKKIKKTGKLFIYEQRSGHAFHFKLDRSGHQCLRFHIDRSDVNGIGVRSGGLRVKDPNAITMTGLLLDDIVERDALTTVPNQLFDNVARLFEQHTARFTLFERIRLDNNFLDQYSRVAKGTAENRIRFGQVKIDDSLDPIKFSEFLLAMNISYFMLEVQDFNDPTDFSRIAQIFDAEFLSKFVAVAVPSKEAKRLSVMLSNVHSSWTATIDLLPIITQFHTIHLQFMKVDPEFVIELVVISMEAGKLKSYYFGLTREMTSEDYSINRTIEVYPHNQFTTYVINKIGTNLECRLWMCFGDSDHLIISVDIDNEYEG